MKYSYAATKKRLKDLGDHAGQALEDAVESTFLNTSNCTAPVMRNESVLFSSKEDSALTKRPSAPSESRG